MEVSSNGQPLNQPRTIKKQYYSFYSRTLYRVIVQLQLRAKDKRTKFRKNTTSMFNGNTSCHRQAVSCIFTIRLIRMRHVYQ